MAAVDLTPPVLMTAVAILCPQPSGHAMLAMFSRSTGRTMPGSRHRTRHLLFEDIERRLGVKVDRPAGSTSPMGSDQR
jgi:hypothetical protein